MKKIIKIIGSCFLIIIILLGGLLAFLTISEYRPEEKEQLEVPLVQEPFTGEREYTAMSYNIGYGSLGYQEDFFMDGGAGVRPESKARIEENLGGIAAALNEHPADFYLLQEVDLDSKRSYHIDQKSYLEEQLGSTGVFAYNFNCSYVPYPFPTIGKVASGLLSLTRFHTEAAERIALPVPFSWPVRTCNLKRCLLVSRIPVAGSDHQLVLVNFHLEAYDDGIGQEQQTVFLMNFLSAEYQRGNYVVAGGDFNQIFEQVTKYPVKEGAAWEPGKISEADLAEGFSFAISDELPTCRLLDKPYEGPETNQVYVIDGFLVSDNVKVSSVQVVDTQFRYADHQPVILNFRLHTEE